MPRAMLLCAGLSTRLGDLGSARPKPLLPVCDVPILRFGICNLVAHGIRDIVINLHHRGELIESELGEGSALGARIQYSRETTILGTGGGIKQALPLLDPEGSDEPFVVCNGKLIFDLDFRGLFAAFSADANVEAMMVLRRSPRALQWGAVDVDDTGGRLRVRNILGDGQHMFTGVHITRPSAIARLPDGESCVVRQGYLPWIQAGQTVSAYEAPLDLYFAEHSTPERYLQSNLDLLGSATLAHPPEDLIGVHPSARIADGATLRHPVKIGRDAVVEAGATVGPRAVVGTGCTVRAGATITDAVLWPKTEARGAIDRSVVTEEGTVAIGN